MGLSCSSDFFCQKTDEAFEGLDWLLKIVDDGLIQAPDEETLLVRIEEVLKRCRLHNIKLSFDKLAWGTSIKFAGYIVSADGVRPDDDKVKGISSFPTPGNLTDLRSFLGLANQLGSFIPDLSQSSSKMRELLKKGVAFVWTDEHATEFQKVKDLLTSPLLVKPFDPNMNTALLTDASRLNGMGYALVQYWPDNKDVMNLIQCGSASFTPTQQNYATIELEALAIKWDHKPLVGIFAKDLQDLTNQRLINFREKLVDYNFQVVWDAGKNHLIADALSRAPTSEGDEAVVAMMEGDDGVFVDLCYKVTEDPALKSLCETAKCDKVYQRLIQCFKTNDFQSVPSDYQGVWHDISLLDDTLLVLDGCRIVVPPDARRDILRLLHLPHTGIVKTYENARQKYFWPTMKNDIKQVISSCSACLEHLPSQQQEPLQQSHSEEPMERVDMDFFSLAGQDWLVMVDRFSGYPFVQRFSNGTTADKLVKVILEWFLEYGFPQQIHSDNGPQFSSSTFREFCEKYGIRHTTSSPHFPQANGGAEAGVKNMKKLMAKCLDLNQSFPVALLEWKNCPRSNGLSPAQAFHGRKLKTLLPCIRNDTLLHMQNKEVLEKKLQENEKTKEQFDSAAKPLPVLHGGQLVALQNPISKKWDQTGVIESACDFHRSYWVQSEGRMIRRNRIFLRPIGLMGSDDQVAADKGDDTAPRRSARLAQKNAEGGE